MIEARDRCSWPHRSATMTNSTRTGILARALHTIAALAFAAFVLATYWPIMQLLDLERADLMLQGIWIEGHAKRITAVTPGGVADRAGLRVGDLLEFDPRRETDWVLASYRQMPERFRATLPVRHTDGSRSFVTLVPERVGYASTLNDRLALQARLAGLTVMILVGVFMVWARPSLMTWSLLLAYSATVPMIPWGTYFLAFVAEKPGVDLVSVVPIVFPALTIAFVPFALSFPRDVPPRGITWQLALGLAVALALLATALEGFAVGPFERDAAPLHSFAILTAVGTLCGLTAIAALVRTYRRSDGMTQARLRWALLGMSGAWAVGLFALVFMLMPVYLSSTLSGSGRTPGNWLYALGSGLLFPLAFGVAVLRERVVDIQFAVSRTLVYGAVSSLALVFIAAVHWVLGRLLEQSHLAIGLEGLAAIGLGLVLHRATHGINLLVDRVLFRKHHRAEQRLRRITAALPFATDEQSIAAALVTEPFQNLELASVALFHRDSPDGPMSRVMSQGWSAEHAVRLDADHLLVRCLQAEHEPLRLDDPHLLPSAVPEGAALPVLAIPIVNQHVLSAVVLYGSHRNSTLPDPDEVELLHGLAKAAATSHQQIRIATLTREVAAQKARNEQLEVMAAELRTLLRHQVEGHVCGADGKGRAQPEPGAVATGST